MTKRKLYEEIAVAIDARNRCSVTGNDEWKRRWQDRLDYIARELLPRGSGFDCGTSISDESTAARIVLETSFHHMNETGYYDGWTSHKIIMTPSFIGGCHIRVTGRNRNDIKQYIGETFAYCVESIFDAPADY